MSAETVRAPEEVEEDAESREGAEEVLKHADHPVQPTPEGSGPLLQRDYVLVVRDAACTPEAALEKVRADFPSFSPEQFARFKRPEGETGLLGPEDRMGIDLTGYGYCEVVLTDLDPLDFTLRTIQGHAEAGRITFAALTDISGNLVLRIRSRARAFNPLIYVGHALLGQHMQTRIWMTFLQRWAEACGGEVLGDVICETDRVEESRADRGEVDCPTVQTEGAMP